MKKNFSIVFLLLLAIVPASASTLTNSASKALNSSTSYSLHIQYNPEMDLLYCTESIRWVNPCDKETNKIYIHLPYEGISKMKFSCSAGKFCTQGGLSFVKLKSALKKNMPVVMKIRYEYRISPETQGHGISRGTGFAMLSDFFLSVNVYDKNLWHPDFKGKLSFKEYSDYSVVIESPSDRKIGASADLMSKQVHRGSCSYFFESRKVTDFSFFIYQDMLKEHRTFKRKDGTCIGLSVMLQPENSRYFQRCFDILYKALGYFESNIGQLNSQELCLLDVPGDFNEQNLCFPGLFSLRCRLISPESSHALEQEIVYGLSRQYFYEMLSPDKTREEWLDSGIADFFAEKLSFKYFGQKRLFFNLADYFPVSGVCLLSFNDIPILYTLGRFHCARGTRFLSYYYGNQNSYCGSISDSTGRLPDEVSYNMNTRVKPPLMLQSLENLIGQEAFIRGIRNYYNKKKYSHASSCDLIEAMKVSCRQNLEPFWRGFYWHQESFDYGIKGLRMVAPYEYELICFRRFGGCFPSDVVLYTDAGQIVKRWDGQEEWKLFRFYTKSMVQGAGIDPDGRDLFDIDRSNNFLSVRKNFRTPVSLALKWFFWIQNALMLTGSLS